MTNEQLKKMLSGVVVHQARQSDIKDEALALETACVDVLKALMRVADDKLLHWFEIDDQARLGHPLDSDPDHQRDMAAEDCF